VFFLDGSTYEYSVRGVNKAKTYAHSIVTSCFRKPEADGSKTYYPLTKIEKVNIREISSGREVTIRPVAKERLDEKKK
jgi:hypothetical protein